MVWVVDAHYVDGYKIFVKFNDEKESIVDLETYIKGKDEDTVFALLKNKENFKNVKFDEELDTIVWQNGADIAPETLYQLANHYTTPASTTQPLQA